MNYFLQKTIASYDFIILFKIIIFRVVDIADKFILNLKPKQHGQICNLIEN